MSATGTLVTPPWSSEAQLYRPVRTGSPATGTVSLKQGELPAGTVVDVAEQTIGLPFRDDQTRKASWRAGSRWLIRNSGAQLTLHDHAFDAEVLMHDPASDPLGAAATSVQQLVGEQAIWEVTTSNTAGIRSYDPVAGTRDLVRYPQDASRGAMTPGTDGVDLVWTEGEGREPGAYSYPIRSMMTSPFTTDPSALEPRRLRSDLSTSFGTAGNKFHVACGFAAKDGGVSTKDAQIVRLSDGHGWVLEHTPLVWQVNNIVGITCDEVFVVVQLWTDGVPQGSTIQRIRLDALGEGIPPD